MDKHRQTYRKIDKNTMGWIERRKSRIDGGQAAGQMKIETGRFDRQVARRDEFYGSREDRSVDRGVDR